MIRLVVVGACASLACSPGTASTAGPAPEPVVRVDTVVITRPAAADSGLQEAVARLRLQLYERDAQIVDLEQKLDQAIDEVVRSMARLQSLASRAEAASAIAEAEIAVNTLASIPGSADAPERNAADGWLRMSNAEFNGANYGGAVYLATEARTAARRGTTRLGNADPSGGRGERLFALPLRLHTTARSNVRDGPGLAFSVLFTLEPDTELTGHGFVDTWVRISDAEGRTGWIFHSLVTDTGGR